MIGITELSAMAVGAIGVALTILNIIDKIAVIKVRAHEPNKQRDEKIAMLEGRLDELEDRLNDGAHRIEVLEAGQKELLHGVSALLSYYLDNTNKEEIQRAKKDLDNYLINKS